LRNDQKKGAKEISRTRNNRLFASSAGAFYDWGMQRESVARRYLRLVVGADAGGFFRVMDAVTEVPDRSSILDVPCGGGVTIRRLRPGQRLRYVALDISPVMLKGARRRVPPEHHGNVELVEGNIEQMPFDDGEFDLVVCFSGLHCLPDPAAAVREIARCLRPGGRLVGDVATSGQLRRTDAFMTLGRRAGVFGPAITLADARRWIADAGLTINALEQSGALTYFDARRGHL
jgi:ubiquinone/menaquinone biosynthesis C-methylase UbiE